MAILEDPVTTWIAFVCTWLSNAICIYLICQHVRNYTQPGFQRYICRIIFIVPFYCTASYFALHHRESSIYFETPRDCYEAWVIYNFMSLCMAYVGGPGAVVVKSEGKLIQPSWVLCTCCMKPIPVDGFFLRNCKQGTLQFVIIKPILAVLTLILFAYDWYQVGNWTITDGYLYEAIIYNFCYSLALFWMLLFYVGTDELLKPYKPLLKFFVFKTVIFLTFWQGLVVTFMATRFGWSPEDSEALQNWLICVEMFLAAVGMFFAFPATEYTLGGTVVPGWSWDSLKHAISISDVIEDIIFQFNPGYKSYVLHTDGGPSENVKRKKFRGKRKKKPAFTVIQNELGHLGEKITKMTKLKPDKHRLPGDVDNFDIEEGVQWHSAARKDNLLRNIGKGVVDQSTALVKWIPGITELERGQAELLDSDSDADYDEDNLKDNQLDDEVLTSSSDEDVGHHRRVGRRGGQGHDRHRGGQLDTRGSSSDEEGGGRQRRQFGHMLTGRSGALDVHALSGAASMKQEDASWAQFPGPYDPREDPSWAEFDKQNTIGTAPDTSHAAAEIQPEHQAITIPPASSDDAVPAGAEVAAQPSAAVSSSGAAEGSSGGSGAQGGGVSSGGGKGSRKAGRRGGSKGGSKRQSKGGSSTPRQGGQSGGGS